MSASQEEELGLTAEDVIEDLIEAMTDAVCDGEGVLSVSYVKYYLKKHKLRVVRVEK